MESDTNLCELVPHRLFGQFISHSSDDETCSNTYIRPCSKGSTATHRCNDEGLLEWLERLHICISHQLMRANSDVYKRKVLFTEALSLKLGTRSTDTRRMRTHYTVQLRLERFCALDKPWEGLGKPWYGLVNAILHTKKKFTRV